MSLKMNEAPYQRSPRTTFRIMMELCIALGIVWLAAVIYNFTLSATFGIRAILLMVVALVTTALVDVLVTLLKHKKGGNLVKEIIDGITFNYSYVTAIIFTLCCPVYISYYVIIIGSLAATGIKHCFGGFGKNIFNPAIIGRILVGIGFPTAFQVTKEYADVTASATLTTQYSGLGTKWLSNVLPEGYDLGNLLIGNYGGALGETFTILILVLGIVLMVRQVINWRSSVFYLGTVAITSLFIGFFVEGLNPFIYMMYHLCLGGLMFGAIFMITDPVTSPTSPFGKALIGVIAGLITVLIRVAGGYPEGVMYCIALVNIIAPVIDKLVVGRTIEGQGKKWAVIGTFLVASVAINTALSVGNAKGSEGGNNSSSSVVTPQLSRQEELFGYEGATYTEITLAALPNETNIVKVYKLEGKKVPNALGYELKGNISWDTGHGEVTIEPSVGVVIGLDTETILDVNLLDAYGTADNFKKPVPEYAELFIGKSVSEVASLTHTNGFNHDANCNHSGDLDITTGSTVSKGAVLNLIAEACKQFDTADKFVYSFGEVSEVEAYTLENSNIKAAYTFTKGGNSNIAYYVNLETGFEIDTHYGEPTIAKPVVAVAIDTTTDTITATKILGLPTTEDYAKLNDIYALADKFVGKTVEEVSGLTDMGVDSVANATISSNGILSYVKEACAQYTNIDKALLSGGAE